MKPHFSKPTKEQQEALKKTYGNLSKWAKINPGQTVAWEINPNDVKEGIKDKFDKDKVEFTIYDPDWDHEFLWQAPPGAASAVIALLARGITFMNITRTGDGNETRYKVEEPK